MPLSPHPPLRLALIGMSGAGKSHWTKNLAAHGCPAVCCDDEIESRLAPALQSGGYTGINGVAAWMGWPDSPTHAKREAQYLAEERRNLGPHAFAQEFECQFLDDGGMVFRTAMLEAALVNNFAPFIA